MKKQNFEESKVWIKKFIQESFIKIDEKLKERSMNAHLLSLKQHNIKTIDIFVRDAELYIAELEKKVKEYEKTTSSQTFTNQIEYPKYDKLNPRHREAIRTISINNAQEKWPELFS